MTSWIGEAEEDDEERAVCEARQTLEMTSGWCLLSTVALLCLLQSDTVKSEEDVLLRYRILEELDIGSIVGDVRRDLRLDYGHEVLAKLEFRIIAHAAVPLEIGSNSGIIVTAGRVDREGLRHCLQLDLCETSVDVAIRPAEYFRMVKVTIEVVDLNDNAPVFEEEQTAVGISLRESASAGSSFPLPVASDVDGLQYGIKTYDLTSDTSSLTLSVVTRRDGTLEPRLLVTQALDREVRDRYRLLLTAFDGGLPPRNTSIEVMVTVLDSNDHSPVFDRSSYEVSVVENVAVGSSVVSVRATDKDAGQNSEVVYRFSDQTSTLYGHLFGINNMTGTITIRGEIDFEAATIYHLTVLAFDLGPDSLPDDAAVVIRVLDANDHPPELVVSTVSAHAQTDSIGVLENLGIGSFVVHVSVLDRDQGMNSLVTCNISDDSTAGSFVLINRSLREYHVVTADQLDRETRSQYQPELTCWDGDPAATHVTRKRLTIEVLDVNDNRPTFTQPTYEAPLTENSPPGTTVLRVMARDVDLGKNAEFNYAVAAESAASFSVSADGFIVARRSFDREEFSAFSFTVSAVDGGSPSLTGSARIVVNIIDLNDEPAIFRQPRYSFSVGENLPEGTPVGAVWAEDRDTPPNNHVCYAIVPVALPGLGFFTIDADTGVVATARALDREEEPVHDLLVLAYDRDRPEFSSTARVSVQVLDANDNRPVFVYPAEANETIEVSGRVPVGYILARVSAFDVDSGENARLVYALRDAQISDHPTGAFAVDPETGDLYTTAVFPDDDELRLYALVVSALDMGRPATWTEARLTVVVNGSLPVDAAVPAEEARSLTPSTAVTVSSRNLIVFALIMACSLVVSLLLAALLVTLKQTKRKRNGERSRMEALKDHTETCGLRVAEPRDPCSTSEEQDVWKWKRRDNAVDAARGKDADQVLMMTAIMIRLHRDLHCYANWWNMVVEIGDEGFPLAWDYLLQRVLHRNCSFCDGRRALAS